MGKTKAYSMKRIISGYRCRISYDSDSECYLITADRFPGLIEDGMDRVEATYRMKKAIRTTVDKLRAEGQDVPPLDDPDWKRTVASYSYMKKQNKRKDGVRI